MVGDEIAIIVEGMCLGTISPSGVVSRRFETSTDNPCLGSTGILDILANYLT